MLVDKQNELMSDLLFTVHQHGGDDVTWKPPIATFSIYIILWLPHKFSNICKPEEGWSGQPKYCYKKQYTLF